MAGGKRQPKRRESRSPSSARSLQATSQPSSSPQLTSLPAGSHPRSSMQADLRGALTLVPTYGFCKKSKVTYFGKYVVVKSRGKNHIYISRGTYGGGGEEDQSQSHFARNDAPTAKEDIEEDVRRTKASAK